jgi:N-acetylglucosamine repressor
MNSSPLGNRDLIRALNRSYVLNMINTFGPIARAEIARRTGLSPATVTGITAELIENNLVFEKEAGDSRGGRPPILLAFNPKGGYVIGIKLMEEAATGALTDLEATVVAKKRISLSGHTPEAVVRDLSALVFSLLEESGMTETRLLGVGVGVAGIVDARYGLLRQSPIYGWHDVPLSEMLQSLVGVPVYVDNDVNTLALTEKWFGAGQGVDHFLIVTVGRGVGMAIVLNGQFYRGAGGGAGEFGHTVIDPDGPVCECGKQGCLEALVGDLGLVRMAQEAASRGQLSRPVSTAAQLLQMAASGDAGAQAIFARAGNYLGLAIANLITLLNPQKILISGEGASAGDWLFGPMREAIQSHVMPGLEEDTQIQIDPWGDDAWARGAASLVLRKLFESPVHGQATPVPETAATA